MQVILGFREKGIMVSTPTSGHCRYDCIIDVNNQLYKVQIKTARLKDNDSYEFQTRQSHITAKGNVHTKYDANEVDYFASFIAGQVVVVPFNEATGTSKTFRVEKPSIVKSTMNFIEDYTIEKIFNLTITD